MRGLCRIPCWGRFFFIVVGCWCVVAQVSARLVADEEPSPFERGFQSIQAKDAKQHVHTLASDTFEGRHTGTRGGHAASVYIAQQLRKYSLQSAVSTTTYFQEFGNESRNVLGLIPGSDPQLKNEYILIGAHYDHVGYGNNQTSNGPVGYIHNGADDNASGVSAVLEIAEAWHISGERPKRSIILAFWDGEEHGLLGSKNFVANPTCPMNALRCIINMDMVGRFKEETGIELTGIRTMVGLRNRVSEHNRQTNLRFKFSWIVEDNSDHWTFYERKVPFVMPFTGFHDDYHRPSDDVDKVNYDGIQNIARWMYGLTRDLANDPDLPRFRDASFQENAEVQKQREVALPPSEPRLALTLSPSDAGPGRVVAQVYPLTSAAFAGLQAGDRIVKFGDHEIKPETNLTGLILRSSSPVKIHYRRKGSDETRRAQVPLTGNPIRIGINWRDDPVEPHMVAINLLEAGSPAGEAGLKVHDRILAVNGQPFKSSAECRDLLLKSQSPISLLIEREGRTREVSLTIPADEAKQE